MRILIIHNRYQQSGGEDGVVLAEVMLLRSKGHEVEVMEENNDSIVRWTDAVRTTIDCVYSISAAQDTRKRISQFRPDLAHIHNFFPRLSPSVHYACHHAGIPVVQTLHNYRLLCPGATLSRGGKVCEDCVGKAIPWPSIAHGCYRNSKLASTAVTTMLSIHRALGTWTRTVDCFIAPTEFARQKFIQGGVPADKIAVKRNFVSPDPGIGAGTGDYALFVGRLSEEKGIETLLAAWKRLSPDVRLKIVGDGPMAESVSQAAATIAGVEWLGSRSKVEVSRLMADAAFLVAPSICYETFGLVLIEALAAGLPVFTSRLGAMAELISDGQTGKLFTAGNSDELVSVVKWALSRPDQLKAMRRKARLEFEIKYTAEASYSQLVSIYEALRSSQTILATS
jgi:glycosyltransferase involved in cell wall biosynthesis